MGCHPELVEGWWSGQRSVVRQAHHDTPFIYKGFGTQVIRLTNFNFIAMVLLNGNKLSDDESALWLTLNLSSYTPLLKQPPGFFKL